jgi:putative endonuclease
MRQRTFWVSILSSRTRNLYIGVSSDVVIRVHQHKTKALIGYTARYNIDRLVHLEGFPTAEQSIAREEELKSWRRDLKTELIESDNPTWDHLSAGWHESVERDPA